MKRKIGVRAFFLVVCLLPASLWAQGQQNPSAGDRRSRPLYIRGQVRSAETEMTLDMVRLNLERPQGGIVQQKFTDSNGNFEFPGLPGGTYRIIAYRDGYEDATMDVELFAVPRIGVMVYMQPKRRDTYNTSDTTVSARYYAIPKKARKEYEKGVEELFEKQRYEESVVRFRKAIELYPEYYEAYSSLGIALLDMKNYDEAKTCFLKSIELDDKHAQAYFALGGLYNGQQQFQQAEEILLRGVAVDGRAWQGHFELGKAYWGMRNWAKAEEHALRAQEIYQGFPSLHLLLANIYLRKQAYPQALTELNAFLKLAPNSPMSGEVRQAVDKLRANLAADKKSDR